MVTQPGPHPFFGDECLDLSGQYEAENQRLERFPEHEEALAQTSRDVFGLGNGGETNHDLTIRAMAADASSILSIAFCPPVATALATQ